MLLPSAGRHVVYRSEFVEGWDSMMKRPVDRKYIAVFSDYFF